MTSEEEGLILLPRDGRPVRAKAPARPHQQRSLFETDASARRTCDPLTGIRAVIVHLVTANEAAMPCHHFVPGPGNRAHERHTLSLINESRRVHAVCGSEGHELIEHGLSEPDQWTIVIAVGNPAPDARYSEWQVAACAALVRQGWRRYPNLRHVANGSMFGLPGRQADADTRDYMKRLFTAVLDSGDAVAL